MGLLCRHLFRFTFLAHELKFALFGFTLSYDELPRSLLTVGGSNTLPIEISNMTTNVTTPALYAIGTVTSAVSFLVIAAAFVAIAVIQKSRARARGGKA